MQILFLTALFTVLFTAAVWFFTDRTGFWTKHSGTGRIIGGILFGAVTAFSAAFGTDFNAGTMMINYAAPLCAGLFVDPVSGLIAGLIGGISRYAFGRLFTVAQYTAAADSAACILSGLYAAFMYVFLFERKKPGPFYAFTIGAVMGVFHMLAILVLHVSTISRAFSVLKAISASMILYTALTTMAASAMIYFLSGGFREDPVLKTRKEETPITRTFQIWLLVCVSVAFILTFSFTYFAQTRLTLDNAGSLLTLNAKDVKQDLENNSRNLSQARELLKQQARNNTRAIAGTVTGNRSNISDTRLKELAELYKVYEIDVINREGIITASTNPNYDGFDMASGKQSAEFLVLLDGKTKEMLQDFQPITFDSSIMIMYAGVAIPEGFVQVGYDDKDISEFESLADPAQIAADRHVGQNGKVFLADEDGSLLETRADTETRRLSDIGIGKKYKDGAFFFADIEGIPSYCLLSSWQNYQVIVTLPKKELYETRDIFAYETALMEILLFTAIFILIFLLVRIVIVRNLQKVNESLARITNGNLSEVVNVRTNAEFTSLSEDINSTVKTLKHYIREAEQRINKELEFAKAIQLSALPSVFPPFPEHKEFDLYAMMKTAKEVGGDFYDYFFVDSTHLALVIADVSGKGIPAALFMMKSKTLIKSLCEAGKTDPVEILVTANRELCDGNEAEMFVTVWLGILNLETFEMRTANAGHEYPAVRHGNGKFALLTSKHSLVLAAMPNAKFRGESFRLAPGDCLFVYTDGVTEATDASQNFYGTDRMLRTLNGERDDNGKARLERMKADIDAFVGEAPQFDDITMMSFEMMPQKTAKEKRMKLVPKIESISDVIAFVETDLRADEISERSIAQVDMAVDEIFSNIAHYSGATEAEVKLSLKDGDMVLEFSDNGRPYDPTAKKDPDVTLPLGERKIGGLGIYMVKKIMDRMEYKYLEGKNILTIEKHLERRSRAPEDTKGLSSESGK